MNFEYNFLVSKTKLFIMKNTFVLTIAFLLFIIPFTNAQTTKLVGMGQLNGGSIFSINDDGSNPEKWMEFKRSGSSGYTNLIESNGKLWGVTLYGGLTGNGVIFNLNVDGTNYTVVHNFDENSGSPAGSLAESNGKIWGLTDRGGLNGFGEIFNLNLDGTNYSVIHEFDNTNGKFPRGNLIESNNKLWGMTGSGGAGDYGVIFNMNLDGTNFVKVHDFDNTNGRNPIGSLILSNGKFWGMTANGGIDDKGAIFKLDLDGANFTKIHDFDGVNGWAPFGSLTESNGKLWGMTWIGGLNTTGVIFNLNIDGTGYTKIHDFDTGNNGAMPSGNLTESNGKLWGMTANGGGNGTIFNLDLDGTNFIKVNNLNFSVDGSFPKGSLIESNGKLWGLTSKGGLGKVGVIFNLNVDGTNYTKVHDFQNHNGIKPTGRLLEANKKLWGMTQEGGSNGLGVIFNMDRDGSNYMEVHHFDGTNGGRPICNLIESNGKIWGMTRVGGANRFGEIFSLNLDGTNYKIVHSFTELNSYLRGSLMGSNGKIWGMLNSGGLNGYGSIFSLALDGTNFTVVHDFDQVKGSYPEGNLVESNGKLWGMTYSGGINDRGVIFNLDLEGTNFTKIHDFDNTNGGNPYFNSLVEIDNKLWGMTRVGGLNPGGVIFNLALDGTNFKKVHDFDTSNGNGNYPQGGLVEQNGKLWGLTESGGLNYNGVMFNLNLDGTNYSKVIDLGPDAIGGQPQYGSLTVVSNEQKIYFSLGNKTYGDANFELFASSNTTSPITFSSSNVGILSIEGNTAIINGAGEVDISASQQNDEWYFPGLTSQTITVDKADLSISADDQTIMQGDSIPVLTMSYSGFMNNDNESDITVPTISTLVSNTRVVGLYDIELSGGDAINYTLNLQNGQLTIEEIVAGIEQGIFEISIYPNPIQSNLVIENQSAIAIESIQIYDLKGNLVKEMDKRQTIHPVDDLQSGIYILMIKSEGKTGYQKIIKD